MSKFKKVKKIIEQRLPRGYSSKKNNHIVYYDIENVAKHGLTALLGIKLYEVTVAMCKHYANACDALTCELPRLLRGVHVIKFDEPSPDRADDLLLASLRSDARRYGCENGFVYTLVSNDCEFQRKFKETAINQGVDYKILEA